MTSSSLKQNQRIHLLTFKQHTSQKCFQQLSSKKSTLDGTTFIRRQLLLLRRNEFNPHCLITPHTNILETSPQKLVINMVAYMLQASSYYKVSADGVEVNRKYSQKPGCLQGGHDAQQHCCLKNCGT